MVREILRLQTKTEQLEGRNNALVKENSWIDRIISSLKDDGQGPEIINRLKRGDSLQTIADWLGRPIGELSSLSPTSQRSLTNAIEHYHRNVVEAQDPRYWTNVSVDRCLIEHLVRLYFTWVHPVHMFFDEGSFMESFKNSSDIYCSSSLVNVICAMSCFLLHTAWMTDEKSLEAEGVRREETQAAVSFLRDQFMAEAKSAMNDADPDKMTSIQTYAIMFLVEVAIGRGLEATAHLRVSIEGLTARRLGEQSSEAEEIAAWGILTAQTYVPAFFLAIGAMLTEGVHGRDSFSRNPRLPYHRLPILSSEWILARPTIFGCHASSLAMKTVHSRSGPATGS